MAKSIIQEKTEKLDRECFLCMRNYGIHNNIDLHKHHFMHGTANKKLAEKYGLWAYVCNTRHHEYGPESPHGNPDVDRELRKIAQEKFEELHGHDKWMEVFGKNYL